MSVEINKPAFYTLALTNPKIAGWFEPFPGLRIDALKKPSWLHRTFTRLLLGWKWSDA